ncbi:hypothetical protein [Microtetraspora niveoalba]|uniref:hypothetical protein n=1 Tax=Microtetraspora niveoalba TaxID=46175 RepID=UPI000829EE68|nr:hypothetical protein [Microtetraspora niveoalba]
MEAGRTRPWRLQSQGYVALFGGFAAVTVIALVNAARLDVPGKGRALIAGVGLLGLILDLVMIVDGRVSLYAHTALSKSLVLVVHIVQVGVQKPHDPGTLLLSRGKEHAPMWLAGAVAVLLGALAEYLMSVTLRG